MKTITMLASLALGGLLWISPAVGRAQTTQTNTTSSAVPSLPPGLDAVVKLAQAKMSDTIILTKIKNDGLACNLTTDQILYLSSQGVSQNVISALLVSKPAGNAPGTPAQPAATGAEPPPLDDPPPAEAKTAPPSAPDLNASSGVFLKDQGQEIVVPSLAVRSEDGTPDEIAVLRSYYFKATGPVPKITGDQVTLIHKGPTTDLGQDYVIEGVDSKFIIFKLGTDSQDPGAFKTTGRFDLAQKKMEFNWLNVPVLGVNLFGVSKKKIRYDVQNVDDKTQVCTVVSKLSSACYAFFDGKDFYVFQYVAPPKK
jgi:hypothetical protein